MTGAHFHLAFNHVPVVLVPVAAVMLSYAMASKSADLTKGALVLLMVSTLFGAGAFLTGEPAEEAVEQLGGISTEAIEAHEELAPIAAAATALAGIFALVVLLKWRPGEPTPWTMIATLVIAFGAAVLLAWTAYLGGRINHPELRRILTRRYPTAPAATCRWTMNDTAAFRQFFAEELRAVAHLRSDAIVRAFATVRREDFLGPGPWQVLLSWERGSSTYRTTDDCDPRHLYHNVLVAIDAARSLNNGHPSSLASWLDTGDSWKSVRSVRVEPHELSSSCWLHGNGTCVSSLPLPEPSAA